MDRSWRLAVVAGCVAIAIAPSIAIGTVGGPDLVEPLGWEPTTGAVFFRQTHIGESGEAPTILRLVPAGKAARFEPLKWSLGVYHDDPSYSARVRTLTSRLRPLREYATTTMPQVDKVVQLGTARISDVDWPRYRVTVGWFNGACEGDVRVVTYRDPSVRMIRYYQVPRSKRTIGVFSYLGIPYESGYEVQVPVLLPQDGDSVFVADPYADRSRDQAQGAHRRRPTVR